MPPKTAAKSTSSKTPCPLFPPREDDEKSTFVEDIDHVRISRVRKEPGRNEVRETLGRQEWPLEIDLYQTTEQDLVDAFLEAQAPGVYYIEPIGPHGQRLSGGHNITIASDSEESEPDERAREAEQTPQAISFMEKQLEAQERAAKALIETQKEHARREVGMYTEFASTMMKTQAEQARSSAPSEQVLQTLNNELAEVRRQAMRDLQDEQRRHSQALEKQEELRDEMRKTHQRELDRRDREIEDIRRNHQEALGKKDREIEDTRRKAANEEDELRRRARDEVTEMRTRNQADLDRARTELLETKTRTQTDLSEIRTRMQGEQDRQRDKYEREIDDLKKQNATLQQQRMQAEGKLIAAEGRISAAESLAKVQSKVKEPEAEEQQPWWMSLMQTEAGQKMVGGILERFVPTEARPPTMQPPMMQAPEQAYMPPGAVYMPGAPEPQPDAAWQQTGVSPDAAPFVAQGAPPEDTRPPMILPRMHPKNAEESMPTTAQNSEAVSLE